MKKKKQKKINITAGHCWLVFDNGYTISIFNGFGSYSENHFNYKLGHKMLNNEPILECKTDDCEIAIMKDDRFCTRNFIESDDSVKGYVSTDELAEIIYKVKNYKETENEKNN